MSNSLPSVFKSNRVHFIGIGGIGMSGLARLFLHEGKVVSGSDRTPSDITRALQAEGVMFFEAQVKENITAAIDVVVYTEAMPKDHEELVAARALGIPTMNYFEALGMVANEYYVIAVSGSHGKTTTTAMLIDIFEAAGRDPSAIVGSLRAKTKSNYRAGKSKYFIVEACEYRRDFMSLEPDVLVITNIEYEHVDYYENLAAVQAAFRDLARKVPEDGFIIANLSDENVQNALGSPSGEPGGDPRAGEVQATVVDYSKFVDPLRSLKMPGLHNQLNAAAAVAAAVRAGISTEVANSALANFAGTWRRFEYKGEVNGAKVYDDYGHHPSEIKATIQGARELYPDKKLTLVFQSHTYSRTHELFADFVSALKRADRVYVLPIYAAREENTFGVTHTQLAEAVRAHGGDAQVFDTFDTVITTLKNSLTSNDVVLVMGAGDITQIATKLVS